MTARNLKPGKGRKADQVRREKYARARGRGASRSKAAAAAGFTSKRAKRGITGYDLERDPRVRQLMHDEMSKDMSETEVKNRLAAQARGEIPTKVVVGPEGPRAEFDSHAAGVAITRVLGLNKETHRFEMPVDRDEALREIQEVLKLFGVEATIEEISAKVEAAA